MKYEIEVKAKVKNIDSLCKKLKKERCKISKPIIQKDYIFNQKNLNLRNLKHNTIVLRIREQNNKTIFTLKKNRSGELDCIEKEIEVSNKKILEEIIKILGFKKTVTVYKERREGKYKNYKICLDKVRGLGTFIEIEKISKENSKKIQTEMFKFIETLGIKKEDRIFMGYDSQIWRKNNKLQNPKKGI